MTPEPLSPASPALSAAAPAISGETLAGVGERVIPEPAAVMNGAVRRQDHGRPAWTRRVWPSLWLYLVVTWLAAGGLKVMQPATHIPTQVLTITQFGPSIAVLVVLATRRGAAPLTWPGPAAATLRRIAVGFAVLAGVFGLSVAGLAVTGRPVHLTSPGSLGEPFWLIAVAQLAGACGEELGWRSFLQPQLQQRYSPVVSALIVGVLWGTWHVEYFGDGLPFVVAFVAMAMAISVILADLIQGVSSLAVAGVFHWLLNLAVLLLLNFSNGDLADVVVLAAGFVVAAVVLHARARLRPAPAIGTAAPS